MKKYFQSLNKDLPAGLVVFLVALPLCLGVALASGAPLLSGLISGIIGGLVVGFISKSPISVSGPAAGLTAVVLSAILTLGSFEAFLLSVCIAGIIQLIMGFGKLGFIADFIPSNVIKGLLAAIGIILILKQIPHAVGYDKDYEGEFSFIQPDGANTFSELLNTIGHFSYGAIIIALFSLLILKYWEKFTGKIGKLIPSSLIVVFAGVAINAIFIKVFTNLQIKSEHLVNLPQINNLSDLISSPDFSQFGNINIWTVALTIAIVASLETLLNLEAVENLDPKKRIASPNRELIAQGVGNLFSGLMGGIPITSVIVRSSVNIHAGAVTKASTIIHGLFLLSSILFLAPILNLIPLSSLAAILIFTGYKLAKISLFKSMYNKGLNQFIPFVATIGFIVFFDLLIGILFGLVISIFYILKSNFKKPYTSGMQKFPQGKILTIELSNQVTFLNKARIKQTLWNIPENSRVNLDASQSDFIDNDILELIADFKNTVSKEKQIQLNILGLKSKYQLEDHIEFINVLDKKSSNALSPTDILELLKEGNNRFLKGVKNNYANQLIKHQIKETSTQQSPMAVVLSCIDSRVSPEIIFDANIGEIMSIRIAGNIINQDIIDSIELACKKMGVRLIVILGHSNCGAVINAIENMDNPEESKININSTIQKSIKVTNSNSSESILADVELIDAVIHENIVNSSFQLMVQSNYLSSKIKADEIDIISGYYNTHTGKVDFFPSFKL